MENGPEKSKNVTNDFQGSGAGGGIEYGTGLTDCMIQ